MAKEKFRIKIEKPCSASMEEFSRVDRGFYCAQCVKCVVDYRQLSDQGIVKELLQDSGKEKCGIFTLSQLEKVYQEKTLPNRVTWGSLLLSGLLLTSRTSNGQTALPLDTIITVQPDTLKSSSAEDSSALLVNKDIDGQKDKEVESLTEHPAITLTGHDIAGNEAVLFGFMQMEPLEQKHLYVPFDNFVDSTKAIFSKLLLFFYAQNPKPLSPKNPLRNTDRPLWLESLRSGFRRRNKNG